MPDKKASKPSPDVSIVLSRLEEEGFEHKVFFEGERHRSHLVRPMLAETGDERKQMYKRALRILRRNLGQMPGLEILAGDGLASYRSDIVVNEPIA